MHLELGQRFCVARIAAQRTLSPPPPALLKKFSTGQIVAQTAYQKGWKNPTIPSQLASSLALFFVVSPT